jgi:hypothetical protein
LALRFDEGRRAGIRLPLRRRRPAEREAKTHDR